MVFTWSPKINFSHLLRGGSIPTVFCVEYKTVDKTQVFSDMETNSIYAVGVKYLSVVKAKFLWVAQVIEGICTRTGS